MKGCEDTILICYRRRVQQQNRSVTLELLKASEGESNKMKATWASLGFSRQSK